ncbi:MAG: MraY family glycosyltransferase [Spirochaetia bacterium]
MASSAIYIFAFILPAVINLLITPGILKLSHTFYWYDSIDHRKIHTENTPRLGGVGIFISVLISFLIIGFIGKLFSAEGKGFVNLLPLLGGITMIHIMGLVDDFHDLRAYLKFFIQITAAVILILGGIRIETVSLPFHWEPVNLGIVTYPVSALWLVGIANAVNLIDGMDSLAGGFGFITSVTVLIISLLTGNLLTALFSLIFIGSLVGFLVFNFPPAKIFMGDSGSLFIGFTLAALPLIKTETAVDISILFPAITLFLLPVSDTLTAICRRLGRGLPVYNPDKEHIHHKLLEAGYNVKQILVILLSATVILNIPAVLWHIIPKNTAIILIFLSWAAAGLGHLILNKKYRFVKKLHRD